MSLHLKRSCLLGQISKLPNFDGGRKSEIITLSIIRLQEIDNTIRKVESAYNGIL